MHFWKKISQIIGWRNLGLRPRLRNTVSITDVLPDWILKLMVIVLYYNESHGKRLDWILGKFLLVHFHFPKKKEISLVLQTDRNGCFSWEIFQKTFHPEVMESWIMIMGKKISRASINWISSCLCTLIRAFHKLNEIGNNANVGIRGFSTWK